MSSSFSSDALSGEVALVTGASRGIGAAIAAALTMVRLAGQDLGNTPWDDVAPSG